MRRVVRVDKLRSIAPLAQHLDFNQLKLEMPLYIGAAARFKVDHESVHTFTEKVLD